MSFNSWNVSNGGESGNDFQSIARDTNFRFNTHRGRVNWDQIEKLSIERLIEEHNVGQLGHNIHNVVSLDIESEFDVRILNSNFVKIFKLSQLTNDFLLHCKRHLSQQRFLLKADLDKVSRKLTQAKKENLELKKIIHWNKLRSAHPHVETQDTAESAMCGVCGKLFQFESYLIMHYSRRHPDMDYALQKSDSYLHNYDKEPGECGVNTSITGGGRGEGGGGYRPSRDRRYTAELESLRNLINAKLGTSKSVQTVEMPFNTGVVTAKGQTGEVSSNTRVVTSKEERIGSSQMGEVSSNTGIVAFKPGTSGRAQTGEASSLTKSGESSVHRLNERDVNQRTGGENREMDGRDNTSRMKEEAKVDGEEKSSKILKEDYEKHLSTMENAWRKQFQELDKKYQHEIKKLQEELKATMEQNKLTCQILILEKDKENAKESTKASKRDGKQMNFESELIRRRITTDDLNIDEPSTSSSITHRKNERNDKKLDDTNSEIYDLKTNKYPLIDNTSTQCKEDKNLEPEIQKMSRKDLIKYPNGSEKFNHWRMIRDELFNKVTEDKRKREEQKYEELKQSLSPKERTWSGTGSTVLGEMTKQKTLCKQQSIYDFARQNEDCSVDSSSEQNRVENQTNQRRNMIKDDTSDTQSTSVNKTDSCDMDQPVRLRKIEQANAHKNNNGETIQVPKENDNEIFRKQKSSSDFSNDARIPNYQNFLEYLNQNDEITKEQLKGSHLAAKRSEKEADTKTYFFENMNTNVFDFKRNVTKKNGLFFNEDFQRDVSNLVAIKPTSMENILDKTFRMNEKLFRYDPDRKAAGDKADTEAIRNAHDRLTTMEAILNKIDSEKQPNQSVGKSKQSNIILEPPNAENPNPRIDRPLSSLRKKDSADTPSRQVMLPNKDVSTNKNVSTTIKRSAKYFRDSSSKSNDIPSIIFTNSSSEAIDKLITVINPNSEFDLEAIDSSSESSKSDVPDDVDQTIQVAPTDAASTVDDFSVGKQITVTRAEYEILAKDLSTIVEETESEGSPSQSVATNGKATMMMGILNSDDSHTLTGSKETPLNEEHTQDKASSKASAAQNEVSNTDEIVDGRLRDERRKVDLVYWNGELRTTSGSFEGHISDQTVTGSLATCKGPARGANKMDVQNETEEKLSTKEHTLTNDRGEDSKPNKKEKLKIKVVLKERFDEKIIDEEDVTQKGRMDHKRREGEVLEIKADIENNNRESVAITKELEKRKGKALAIKEEESESKKENSTVEKYSPDAKDKPKGMYGDLNENEENMLGNNEEIYGNASVNEDELPKSGANEGMCADLNERNDADRLVVKEEVMYQFERIMKNLNLNAEWTRLPYRTFQQKLNIIEHDRLLKKKNIKNMKDNIRSKVDSILNKKINKRDGIARNLHYRETNETHEDKNDNKLDGDKRTDKIIDNLNEQYNVSRIKVLEKSQKSPNIREIINKKLTDILRKDIKSTSEDNNQEKSDTKREEHEKFKTQSTDYISIDTPAFDLNGISNIARNLKSGKASETSEWETMNSTSSSSEEEELNKKNRENQTSKSRGKFNQTQSQSKKASKNNSNNIDDVKVRSTKQAFESRLTKKMYSNIKTDANEILDRERDYLQTNNFTSQQTIEKSHTRGYNFFSKSKNAPTDKLNTTKSKSSDKFKPQLTDTDDNLGRRHVQSLPSSMKESSQNTFKSNSSKASSILDDHDKPKDTSEDLFVIKAPYNLFTASESNFQIKQCRQKPDNLEEKGRNSGKSKEDRRDNQTSYGYTHSRLDCGDVGSESITRGPSTKDTTKNIALTSVNLFGTTERPMNVRTEDIISTKSTNAYLVPNERDVHQKTQLLVPLRDDDPFAGTIRSMAKAIQDEEDSTSSFELDEFLEKNNIG